MNRKFKIIAAIGVVTLLGWQLPLGDKPFDLKIPKGFAAPHIPAENQLTEARVELGKKLFYDPILSRDTTISCASCHFPHLAFTDGKKNSIGIRGQKVKRNSPTLTNVIYNDKFLLDGVNPSLEKQIDVPIQEHNEFDFHVLLIVDRLNKIPKYVELSQRAYGSEITPKVIQNAIASFERTLISGNSRFDQFYYQGDSTALNNEERLGLSLFMDRLYCTECHEGFNFTNYEVHNTGLYEVYPDSGRYRLTNNPKEIGVFKVPTLRNIALTGPYMHDGSFTSLEEIIDHYSNGGQGHFNQSPIIQKFSITSTEKKALVAFLKTLTDSSFITNQAFQ